MTNSFIFDIFSLNDHQPECKSNKLKNDKNCIHLIFDLDQAYKLRDNIFRLCGNKVSFQNSLKQEIIPFQLSNEEICVLYEKNKSISFQLNIYHSICTSYINNHENELKLQKLKQMYDDRMMIFLEKESSDLKKNRLEKINQIKEKIFNGKKNKLSKRLIELEKLIENDDSNKAFKIEHQFIVNQLDDLENDSLKQLVTPAIKPSNLVEIFLKTPDFYQMYYAVAKIINENYFLNQTFYYSNRYKIYKYFWSVGFHLTCGSKFGGDYLVYPGDPAKYHSKFIIACIDFTEKLTLKQLITYARMATSVKKTFVLAYCIKNQDIENKKLKIKNNLSTALDDGQTNIFLISVNWSHL